MPARHGDAQLVWRRGARHTCEAAGPRDVAAAPDGTLLIADTRSNVIRHVAPDGVIGTLAGDGTIPSRAPRAVEPAAHPRFDEPSGVAVAPDGSVLVADTGNDAIRRVTADGKVRIVLGGPARLGARLERPEDVVALPNGDLLVADTGGHRVLRLTAAGAVELVAGIGLPGATGDGGPATSAALAAPVQIVAMPDGGLLIADAAVGLIRRVDGAGVITTVAAVPRNALAGVTSAPDGSVVAAIGGSSTMIQRFDPAPSRIAGTGRDGFSGDGVATDSELSAPRQLAPAADGSVLIAEAGNDRIRRLTTDGRLVTVVGSDRPRGRIASVPAPRRGGGQNHGGAEPRIDRCYSRDPQFEVFNLLPASSKTLYAGRTKVTLHIQTSVTAKVVVRLQRRGADLRRRVKRVRNDRSATPVTLKARLSRGARYIVDVQGRAVHDSDIKRCDRRRLRVR